MCTKIHFSFETCFGHSSRILGTKSRVATYNDNNRAKVFYQCPININNLEMTLVSVIPILSLNVS